MADTLALEKLYIDVIARFTAEGNSALAASCTFGWREPPKQLGPTNRIVWVPGTPAGSVGKLGPPKYPGGNPRSLGTLFEAFYVDVHGFDATAPDSELAQWKAARLLFDVWFRAVYLAAVGTFNFELSEPQWLKNHVQRANGAVMRVTGSIQSMIPDSARAIASTLTEAVITTSELDVDDPPDVIDPETPDP